MFLHTTFKQSVRHHCNPPYCNESLGKQNGQKAPLHPKITFRAMTKSRYTHGYTDKILDKLRKRSDRTTTTIATKHHLTAPVTLNLLVHLRWIRVWNTQRRFRRTALLLANFSLVLCKVGIRKQKSTTNRLHETSTIFITIQMHQSH